MIKIKYKAVLVLSVVLVTGCSGNIDNNSANIRDESNNGMNVAVVDRTVGMETVYNIENKNIIETVSEVDRVLQPTLEDMTENTTAVVKGIAKKIRIYRD